MAKKAVKTKDEPAPEQTPAEELREWITAGMANYKAGLERRLAEVVKDGMSASDLALTFAHLRQAQNAVEDATAPLDEVITRLNDEVLPEAFQRDNVTSINTSIGFRVVVSYRLYASIVKGEKDAAYEWLRANQMGDLIQPVVNASTLAAEVRKLLEDGKEMPDTLFTVSTKPGMSLTKIAEKK